MPSLFEACDIVLYLQVGGVISAMSPWKPARKESPAEVPEETASIKPPVEESTTLGKRKEAPKKEVSPTDPLTLC